MRRTSLLAFALFNTLSPLYGQGISRKPMEVQWGETHLEVSARAGFVSICGSEPVDYVCEGSDPRTMRIFLNRIDSVVALRPRLGPREEIVFEAEPPERRYNRFVIGRTWTGRVVRTHFYMSDQYIVNSIYIELSSTKLARFTAALRRAIRDAEELEAQGR